MIGQTDVHRRPVASWVGLLLAAAVTVAADDPTPTPQPTSTPTPRATATATGGARSLADVAREARLQGEGQDGGAIVISNENLAQLASRSELTQAGPTATPTVVPGSRRAVHGGATGESKVVVQSADAGEPGSDPEAADRRRHWREVYLKQVEVIDAMHAEIEHLDAQIPGLWNQFYAWDDPAYRDSVIKPKLDAALAQRQQLEEQLAVEEARLPAILEDARRDGALPGWFRDLPEPTQSTKDDRDPWGVPTQQP